MIARMSKYDLVLYAGQSSDFIEKLRGLGLVDITTTGWEPSDEDRQLLLTIDNHHKAVETLKRFLERFSSSSMKRLILRMASSYPGICTFS